ncbi:Ni/Fe hydrogenase subunit alpha [Persephonella sp.]
MKKVEKILTRVEGEGSISLFYENGSLKEIKLNIFEPPRFIEGILRGKDYHRIIDVTSRICGICPVAYQISGVQAIEDAFGVNVSTEIENLRRLYYFGEWIQSHGVHVFFLHLPDFLDKSSIFEVGRENPELLKIGTIIKNAGSEIIQRIGGRVSHPVSPSVGGFSKFIEDSKLKELLHKLEEALDLSTYIVNRFSEFKFPENEIPDIHFVSLEEKEYPILKGEIISNKGLRFTKEEFEQVVKEYQVDYSTAKKAKLYGKETYIVGPIARFNNSFEKLSDTALKISKKINLTPPVKNSFKTILIRMIEIVHSLEKSIELVKNYSSENLKNADFTIKEGTGYGVSEAPRGILWHKYSFDSEGKIKEADIIPPTSQNQDIMEICVKNMISAKENVEEILRTAEKVIRNFDPCISCATHFLKIGEIRGKKIN